MTTRGPEVQDDPTTTVEPTTPDDSAKSTAPAAPLRDLKIALAKETPRKPLAELLAERAEPGSLANQQQRRGSELGESEVDLLRHLTADAIDTDSMRRIKKAFGPGSPITGCFRNDNPAAPEPAEAPQPTSPDSKPTLTGLDLATDDESGPTAVRSTTSQVDAPMSSVARRLKAAATGPGETFVPISNRPFLAAVKHTVKDDGEEDDR